jgi:hypothetical protein
MGDRVLMQVVTDYGFGPVLYCHYNGNEAPEICNRLAERMRTSTIANYLDYSSARLVQEAINNDNGSLSFCLWNAAARLTAKDSHGDAGVILIHADKDHAWEPLCGYHRADWLAGKWGDHHSRIYGKPAITPAA